MIAIDVVEGDSPVDEIHHIDRGYERIEEALAQGGAGNRRSPP